MAFDLTAEQFTKVLPPHVKKSINTELIDKINATLQEPELREIYRDNLLGYTSVMSEGRFKISSYIDAVRYVSFKLLGDTNIAAYVRTFPDKYQRFLAEGVCSKDIASYVTAYNKGKLVNLIFEQSLVPSHVLNADLYQKALNTQAELMVESHSDKVRCDAANSLLTHLKMPETTKIELDIGLKEDKTINALRESTLALVAMQRQMIKAGGMSAKEVAHAGLVIEHNDVN